MQSGRGGGTEEISREVREGVNKFGKSTINAAILQRNLSRIVHE